MWKTYIAAKHSSCVLSYAFLAHGGFKSNHQLDLKSFLAGHGEKKNQFSCQMRCDYAYIVLLVFPIGVLWLKEACSESLALLFGEFKIIEVNKMIPHWFWFGLQYSQNWELINKTY